VPRKLYLHDGEHVDPFGGDLTGRDSVGRWMDYWLYNINNGIMNEPQATIIRPDGTRTTDAAWPVVNTPTSLYFGPAGSGAAGTLTTSPVSGTQTFTDLTTQTEAQMTANPQTASANRLVYLGPALTASRRLSGIGRVQVTFTSTATSTPLTAMLVHYTNGQPTRIVTRGAIDTKNRDSLSTGTPLVVGQQYTATVELEPKDYIFPAGSRIGLIVAANSREYVDVDFAARQLTVTLGTSRAILPLT
jgi:X-Pro dipeptidyl-peptidase